MTSYSSRPDLSTAVARFRSTISHARASVAPRRFDWYAYDSLANFDHLTKLFASADLNLLDTALEDRLLDVGTADGDVAFCLESVGAQVTAIDHPRSSQNGMFGVRALHAALRSQVEILEMDIDRSMEFGSRQFGLALVLGLLYHVKNPLYVLETVARHAKYCVVSTRITRYLPGMERDIAKVPLAYLLASDELNADDSNFWIFSEAGLERLFERTHWRVKARLKLGDTARSLPNTLDHDERIFCLLESVYGLRHIELLAGWHAPEDSGWRWTAASFSARLPVQKDASTISLRLFVPDALIERFGSVTLSCRVNGAPLTPETFTEPGLYTYTRALDAKSAELLAQFNVDRALPADASDPRERALIVADLSLNRSTA